MLDEMSLDYETASEVDLKVYGLDRYTADPSFRILMGAYSMNKGRVCHWEGPRPPAEVREALADREVIKKAFNAQFEIVSTLRGLGIKTPVESWRCTMVLAFMQSFTGTLEQIGKAVGLPFDKQKLDTGKKLINLFTKPQRITKNQPIRWRDSFTNPVEWDDFCDYNVQDVIAEMAIESRLAKYPVPPEEWELWAIDQKINYRGIPIDMQFVQNAIRMVARRKAELKAELIGITGLANPLSGQQLLPWLQARGYPFSDLQKNTVKRVLTEHEEGIAEIDEEAVKALQKRKQAVRTSTAKYDALNKAVGPDGLFRFGFQFDGASRTGRWAGRRLNPQNLTRTPDEIAPDAKKWEALGLPEDYMLTEVTEAIRNDDYDQLSILVKEPMDALAGTVRSAIRAPEGKVFRACDLSAIETCVIAWLAGCERMLNVVRDGRDPYKDFGTELYSKPYDEITKPERTNSKPAVLGAGYRLGGGDINHEGKRTGLWGYAESMGINLTRQESHRAVKLFRETYPEYPKLWYALEDAMIRAIRNPKRKVQPRINDFRVPVVFEYMKPYLTIILPVKNESGINRRLYYHLPRIEKKTMHGANGSWEKLGVTYMGQPQGTKKWVRIDTHGGKITENIVQAIARDILAVAMRKAFKFGFDIRVHVHDELVALQKLFDNMFTAEALRALMIEPIPGLEGLPLGSSASDFGFYRKD